MQRGGLAAVGLVLVLAGCGGGAPTAGPPAKAGPSSEAPRAVALDGVVIRQEVDPLTNLDIYDSDELFHLARDMARADRVDDAIKVYVRLLEEFAQSAL